MDADDSTTDRVVLHAAVDRINERCVAHTKHQEEVKTWMREVDKSLTQIKFLGLIAAMFLGAALGLAKWMVHGAVTDALVEHGVLHSSQLSMK
jgi:hypothetical protein